jgi:hypothetical protein
MTTVAGNIINSVFKNINNNEVVRTEKVYKVDNSELRVFNNFLSEQDYSKLYDILLDYIRCKTKAFGTNVRSSFVFGHSSIGWHPYYVPHWNFNLTFNDFFRVYIFSKIKEICDWTKDFEIKRIYCSCQTSEQVGNWHYDDKCSNSFTFTLYCSFDNNFMKDTYYRYYNKCLKSLNKNRKITNNITENDEDGYFHIKYSNTPIKIIRTRDNAAVLFNSTSMHNGDCPKYDSEILRCVVAYKLFIPKIE